MKISDSHVKGATMAVPPEPVTTADRMACLPPVMGGPREGEARA
jgi:hypothetical protein